MAIEPFIKCSDIHASIKFYTQVLDFRLSLAPDPDPGSFMSRYAYLERDGDAVHLSSHTSDGAFGNLIYIRVENLDELFEKFIASGLNTTISGGNAALAIAPVEQTWGMKEFSVRDPDGNKITFGQTMLISSNHGPQG